MRVVRAGARVFAAALMVWRLERRLALDELVKRLRAEDAAAQVDLQGAVLGARILSRLLPGLPPWRMGPCFKRSLLLLRVWAQYGVQVELCLGSRALMDGGRSGHAWLAVDDESLQPFAGRPAGEPVVVL